MTELALQTFEEIRALDRARVVALLPVGATEAHGPHLPLGTDVVIAEAMARAAAATLATRGFAPLVLPSIAYSTAEFAAGFDGTISIRPETLRALVVNVARSLARRGIARFAIANAHLEPAHLQALDAAVEEIRATIEVARATVRDTRAVGPENRAAGRVAVAFPDITRKPWALRLGDEFRSGACHAGQYEGSIVLAARPETVREAARAALAPNPTLLARAIRDGKRTFEEAGGPRAYFGDPAAASAEEGRALIETLGQILVESIDAALEGIETNGASPRRAGS